MDTTFQGLHCTSSNRAQILFYVLLMSHIADSPEIENMLYEKRGTRLSFPRYNCLIKAASFNSNRSPKRRNFEEGCNLLKETSTGSSLSQQITANYLVLLLSPVFNRFPMMGLHSSVDFYTIFRFALMHRLALGVSKMFRECVVKDMSNLSRMTTAIEYRPGQPNPFQAKERTVSNRGN